MIKVRYKLEVTSPPDRKGKPGDVKDLPERVAQRLKAEGYVDFVDDKKQTPAAGKKE